MLNKALYSKLKEVFKDVIVEHENVVPTLELRKKPDKLGRDWKFKENGYGETFRINCPICGDSGNFHCYISSASFTEPVIEDVKRARLGLEAHCFRRDCFKNKEAIEKLSKILEGIEVIDITFNVQQNLDFDDSIPANPGNSLDISCLKKWQPDYHTFDRCPFDVAKYILERDLDIDDIDRLHIGWGKCWNAKKQEFIGDDNWLQFPIFDQMGLRGFQSRQLKKDSKMKYFFDFRTPKKMCLYNRAEASKYKIVAICEGVIDAIHIGKAGMAFFGSEPSLAQQRLIQQDGAQMVLYMPDQKKSPQLDPVKVADRVIKDWKTRYEFPWGIHRVDVPGEDAGVCTYEQIWLAAYQQLKDKVPEAVLDALEEQIIKLE